MPQTAQDQSKNSQLLIHSSYNGQAAKGGRKQLLQKKRHWKCDQEIRPSQTIYQVVPAQQQRRWLNDVDDGKLKTNQNWRGHHSWDRRALISNQLQHGKLLLQTKELSEGNRKGHWEHHFEEKRQGVLPPRNVVRRPGTVRLGSWGLHVIDKNGH